MMNSLAGWTNLHHNRQGIVTATLRALQMFLTPFASQIHAAKP
jgi:hypothetical protein